VLLLMPSYWLYTCAAVVLLQRMVMRHVKPHTLLVGHSLDNDLAALKVGTSHWELRAVHHGLQAMHCLH
jgi:hypothetical protein